MYIYMYIYLQQICSIEGSAAGWCAQKKKLGKEISSLHRRSFRRRSFHRIFLGVKMLAKFLRSWASDTGAHTAVLHCVACLWQLRHICSLKPEPVFWATWHLWRRRTVSTSARAPPLGLGVQNIPHSRKMHAWEWVFSSAAPRYTHAH